MNYAYARVSAKDQNLQRQIAAFSEFGIEKSRIFSEKKSGKDFERKEYKSLLKKLNCGNLLVIKSIDRLGRNYSQIIEEWNRITNVIGADILVLDMPLLDTRTKADTLVGKFISDIVLQVLSFVAENERESIKARQAEGIKIAHQKGVRFGRPSFVYSEEFLSVANDYLCNAALCKIFVDREDRIHVRSEKAMTEKVGIEINTSNMFSYKSSITLTEFANSIKVEYTDVEIADEIIDVAELEVTLEGNETRIISLDYSSDIAYAVVLSSNVNVRAVMEQGGVNSCLLTLTNRTGTKQTTMGNYVEFI